MGEIVYLSQEMAKRGRHVSRVTITNPETQVPFYVFGQNLFPPPSDEELPQAESA